MSIRLRLFNLTSRLTVKPLLRWQTDVGLARRSFARLTRVLCRVPPYTAQLPDRFIPGDWIWSRPRRTRDAMLWLHGGGYIVGSPETHRAMVARLARLTGLRVLVPDYRLAPEQAFPAAFEDAVAAWDSLVMRGYAPDRIVIGGDSAGGGLALALAAHLCGKGTPPGAIVAFSPWTDMTLSGASLAENAKYDVFFPAHRVAELRGMVDGGADPKDPRLSPLFADFPACPPVLLQCSGSEILRDDTLRMADRLRVAGAEVSLQVLPGAPHVWQLFDGLVPEARQSLRAAAGFIAAALRAPRPDDS
ncbi:MAG: alpha/beta hydrolase [Rhodobacteraceae bacterium]|nr:alpha/beta hydrolase [Paracoccaceae bacterium]